jgi:putative oxidoreductase
MSVTAQKHMRAGIRWIIGLLLVWAPLSKLANLHEFYVSVAAYQMPLPDLLLRLTAMILPWLELLCGLLLLGNIWTRAALFWAMVMFAMFVLATGQAWARGLDIACGCFNLRAFGLGEGSGKWLIDLVESVGFAFIRALLLFLGAFYLFRSAPPAEPVETD